KGRPRDGRFHRGRRQGRGRHIVLDGQGGGHRDDRLRVRRRRHRKARRESGPRDRRRGDRRVDGERAPPSHRRRPWQNRRQRKEDQRDRGRLPQSVGLLHSRGRMATKILVPVIPSERFFDAVVAAGDLAAREDGTITFLFTSL